MRLAAPALAADSAVSAAATRIERVDRPSTLPRRIVAIRLSALNVCLNPCLFCLALGPAPVPFPSAAQGTQARWLRQRLRNS